MKPTPDDINPYAAPEADLSERPPAESNVISEAEAIRRTYLSHEASISSIGSLNYLGAILFGFGLIGVIMDFALNRFTAGTILGLAYVLVVMAINIALGWGLRSFKPWARWTSVVLLAIPMIVVFFTLIFGIVQGGQNAGVLLGISAFWFAIPGYMLYLLLSKKATYIFTPEYAEIMRMTPHVKYQTSCVVKVFLGLLLALIIFGVVAALLGRR